jgi:hypothetical protein
MSTWTVYHLPIPGHKCPTLWVRGIARHTCTDYWFQPVGHAPKAGAR